MWLLSEALLCGLAIAKYFAIVFHLTQTAESHDLNTILPQQKSLHFYFIQTSNALFYGFYTFTCISYFVICHWICETCPNHTTNLMKSIYCLTLYSHTHHYSCRHNNNIAMQVQVAFCQAMKVYNRALWALMRWHEVSDCPQHLLYDQWVYCGCFYPLLRNTYRLPESLRSLNPLALPHAPLFHPLPLYVHDTRDTSYKLFLKSLSKPAFRLADNFVHVSI